MMPVRSCVRRRQLSNNEPHQNAAENQHRAPSPTDTATGAKIRDSKRGPTT